MKVERIKRAITASGAKMKVGIGVSEYFRKNYTNKVNPNFKLSNAVRSRRMRNEVEGAFDVVESVGGEVAIREAFANKGLTLPNGYIADKLAASLDVLWTKYVVKLFKGHSPEIIPYVLANSQEEIDNFFGGL